MNGQTTHHHSGDGIYWRFRIAPPLPPDRFPQEERLNRAWLALQLRHTSYRAVSTDDYRELVKALREIEQIFLQRPELGAYWAECHRPVGDPTGGEPQIGPYQLQHVIALQARLMDDAYAILHLDRYPNAPANRGWMNLFRSWGQSPTFNDIFDRALAPTLSKAFVDFYDRHVRESEGPIETVPVPHPWDGQQSGVYLDPGIREAAGR